MWKAGVRELIPFANRLGQAIVDIDGPANSILLFNLPDLRGEEMVAEHVTDPTREVPAPQVAIQRDDWSGCQNVEQFLQRARAASCRPILTEHERPPFWNRDIQVFLSMADV
jgi:hypothetical protein